MTELVWIFLAVHDTQGITCMSPGTDYSTGNPSWKGTPWVMLSMFCSHEETAVFLGVHARSMNLEFNCHNNLKELATFITHPDEPHIWKF